jgi:3-oxoacyl-[acyl-carrier-protein] synthase II
VDFETDPRRGRKIRSGAFEVLTRLPHELPQIRDILLTWLVLKPRAPSLHQIEPAMANARQARAMQRVVITGLGPVTAIGVGQQEFHRSQLEARSGVQTISRFDASDFGVRIAAEVHNDLSAWFGPKELKRLDRFTQLAVVAAELALEDARLELSGLDLERVGALIGSGIGGMTTWEAQARVGFERGYNRMSPFTVPMLMANAAVTQIAMLHNLLGPTSSVSTACATGTDAIGQAARLIQHGEADVMLTGSSESMITPLAIGAFSALRAMSSRNDDPGTASRPFDRARDGFVMAEGSAVLILEGFEHARARGARMYAEIIGFGRSADAHHEVEPHPKGEGLARAMRYALRDAELEPGDIDYVNAHATSTPIGDRAEVQAIKQVFGSHASSLSISSTKSMIGHAVGASGSIEAVAVAQAISSGMVPPTANLHEPDPDFELDFVPQTKAQDLRYAISNSSGFGGLNAVLVMAKI